MRVEDSPGLFGLGIGYSTCSGIKCDWCGTLYEDDKDEDKYVSWADFGGKQICQCCFEQIEDAVLSHIDDILPWYARILQARRTDLEKLEENLMIIKEPI